MIRPIWISPRAEQDIVQLATYIGRDSGDAANRFLDAVDQLFDRIAQSPKIGQVFGVPNPRLAGMRASRVIGFPNHLAFYLPNDSGIQIVSAYFTGRVISTQYLSKCDKRRRRSSPKRQGAV